MKLLKIAIAAALLSSTALADDIMTFSVVGKGPDGTEYTGTVTVEEQPAAGVGKGDTFKVTWNTGGAPVIGLGAVDGSNRKVLSVAYSYNGAVGIAVMTESNDKAVGVWAIDGVPGLGTEEWTPVKNGASGGGSEGAAVALTYEQAVECAAATSYVVGMLRATPGADSAKIAAYDKANSAWIIKLGELGAAKEMSARIDDIQAAQQAFAADPDGLVKATPIADRCVANAPPIE